MATTGVKLKALVCAFCPFCAVARFYSESAFARRLRKMEKNCPFCRAYGELKKEEALARARQTPPDVPPSSPPQ